MHLEIKFEFIGTFFKLLSLVLLIANNGLKIARRKIKRVVPYQLIVLYLLERECFTV